MSDEVLARELHAFFGRVRQAAKHGKILVAYDYRGDLVLLNYALDGFEVVDTQPRKPFNSLDLGLLGLNYTRAVEAAFEADPSLRRHHALVDAQVNRNVYVDQRDRPIQEMAELQRLRQVDTELDKALGETFDTASKAARWWSTPSRMLRGQHPSAEYAAGRRDKVLEELAAIRYGHPA